MAGRCAVVPLGIVIAPDVVNVTCCDVSIVKPDDDPVWSAMVEDRSEFVNNPDAVALIVAVTEQASKKCQCSTQAVEWLCYSESFLQQGLLVVELLFPLELQLPQYYSL